MKFVMNLYTMQQTKTNKDFKDGVGSCLLKTIL